MLSLGSWIGSSPSRGGWSLSNHIINTDKFDLYMWSRSTGNHIIDKFDL